MTKGPLYREHVRAAARGIIDMLIEEAPEHRVNRWKKVYPELVKSFKDAQRADPTVDKKYTEWILARVKDGGIRLPEDVDKVKAALETFATMSRLPSFTGPRNVFELKTYGQLADIIEKNDKTAVSHTAVRKGLVLPPGVDEIFDNGTFQVYQINTSKAAHQFLFPIRAADSYSNAGGGLKGSAGHHWCVKDESYAKQYMDDSAPDKKLYCVLKSGKPWMMVSKAGKAANRQDDNSPQDDLDQLFKLDIPERIKLYALRIDALRKRSKFVEDMITKSKDGSMAASYVRAVNQGKQVRFPEFEPLILTSPEAATEYAQYAIGGRWTEAEPMILASKDSDALFNYATKVIKGRWPQAEAALMITHAKKKKKPGH